MAKYIDLPNLKENLTNFLNKKINPIYAKKTEIPSNVSELNNDKSYQTAEEVGQAVTDGVARIVAGAPEDFDTLKEMSDWISSHETSAAAMNSAISDNSVAIANHTSNSDIHVTKEEKTKWNKLDSDLKDGTIIVAEATKATQDAQGNTIDTTYAKKTEVPQGTVVDDALSSTSENAIQNKVVKAEFDKVNSNLDGLEYGENGAYNLLNSTLQTTTINGVTCTSNGDGIYTLNGSTESFPPFRLADVYLEKGTYLIDSFSYDGDNPYLWVGKDGENNNIINQFWTQPLTFTLDSKTLVSIHMVCVPGQNFSDKLMFPMLIKGTSAQKQYKPYIPSVKMLAEEVKAQNESLSVIGKCKNLLKPTLQTTTQNGVTCTKNIDGTYTLNGTATAEIDILIGRTIKTFKKNTKLKIAGMPTTGKAFIYDSFNSFGENSFAYGFEGKEYQTNFEGRYSNCNLHIPNGTSLSNVIIRPMIVENLNVTYDDFVPYTGDGDTLTHDVAELKNDLSDLKDGTTPAAKASGDTSHAEGNYTEANGSWSHAEGYRTTASGDYSHTEGENTGASGSHSHAEGYEAKAIGNCSHAEGYGTEASNCSSHASGKYNAQMTTEGGIYNTEGTAFSIGNGTSSVLRSNAFSVQYDGTVKAKSTITASTTADYAEFFEWLDGNSNNEDRVGYFVTLDGNRIKIASDNDDYILGIVSGEPFVLGNGDCDTWNGMYLHDEFRRTIYEPAPKVEEVEIKEEREETYIDEETGEEKIRTVEVVVGHEFKEVEGEFDGTRPKLNPEYDNTQPYVSRFDRKEWSPVGMLGVLAVRHDGTAKVNGYVTVNKDGIATACDRNIENSYRVIKANTDSVVEIIFK